MTHGSLFSGIGGFDLAAEWMGWENVFQCENDPFCNTILNKHWPNVKKYGDIKTTDFTEWRGKVDVISGGFPCQPFSNAGKQRGVDDQRYLWPQMLEAIRQIDPVFVVGENVYGIAKTALQRIKASLEDVGYITIPFCLPASAVGALHRRPRIWIVGFKENTLHPDPHSVRSHIQKIHEQGNAELQHEQICELGQVVSQGIRDGSDPRVFGNANGVSNRVDRLRAIGNAIVPQVAFEIFRVIEYLMIEGEAISK